MRVPTVEYQIGVMSWSVCRTKLQKVAQLCKYSLQGDTASRVVTAECLNHVVGEEALDVVQHACGAQIQELHLLRW